MAATDSRGSVARVRASVTRAAPRAGATGPRRTGTGAPSTSATISQYQSGQSTTPSTATSSCTNHARASGRAVVASTSRCSTIAGLAAPRGDPRRADEPLVHPAFALVQHVRLADDDREVPAADVARPRRREAGGDVRDAQLVEHADGRGVVEVVLVRVTVGVDRVDVEDHAVAVGDAARRRPADGAGSPWRTPVTGHGSRQSASRPRSAGRSLGSLTMSLHDHMKLPPSTMNVWPVR